MDGRLDEWRGNDLEREREHPYLLFMHFLAVAQWGQMSKQDLARGQEERRKESRRDGQIMICQCGWIVCGERINGNQLRILRELLSISVCTTMWVNSESISVKKNPNVDTLCLLVFHLSSLCNRSFSFSHSPLLNRYRYKFTAFNILCI